MAKRQGVSWLFGIEGDGSWYVTEMVTIRFGCLLLFIMNTGILFLSARDAYGMGCRGVIGPLICSTKGSRKYCIRRRSSMTGVCWRKGMTYSWMLDTARLWQWYRSEEHTSELQSR